MKMEQVFNALAKEKRCAFIPYFILGLPDMEKSIEIICSCSEYFDIVELGIPFTDPVADGPTIQEGSQIVLKHKYNMEDFFAAAKKISDRIKKPVIFMLYYNQVFGYGMDNFFKEAGESGVSGIIVPDMLPESDKAFIKAAKKNKIDNVFLATPVTGSQRLDKIVEETRGFLYLTSTVGITGERDKVNQELEALAKKIKKKSALPVCVGFGISDAAQAKEISRFADGVIVGSAIVKKVIEGQNVLPFVQSLFEAMK